jgi:FkbM family methyltransferase
MKHTLKTLRFFWRSFRARHRDHRCELRALLCAISPGDVAVDVGANKGSFTHSLAKKVGKEGRVIAFEPQKELALDLEQITRHLSLSQIEVVEKAVSQYCTKSDFFEPATGHSPSASLVGGNHIPVNWVTRKIDTVSLDWYLKDETRRIACIKIDVEGHELEVLKGGEATILKNCPVLVFECEQRHLSNERVQDVLQWVSDLGYLGHFVQKGKLRPVTEFRAGVHQRKNTGRYWNSPNYCNNFVFYSQAAP